MGEPTAADGTGDHRHVTRRFGVALAVAVYTSVFFRTLKLPLPIGDVALVPTDLLLLFATVPAVGLAVRYPHRIRSTVSPVSLRVLGVGGVFLVYHGYLWTKSPQPLRGFTLVLLLVRDLLIVGFLGAFLDRADLGRVNKGVFAASAVVAVPAVLLYLIVLVTGNPDALGPLSETVWTVYGPFRAQFLVDDPNFFGMLLLVGLLCGAGIRSKRRYLALGVVALALLTTLSRSVIGLFLVVSFVYSSGAGRLSRNLRTLARSPRRLVGVLGLGIGLGLSVVLIVGLESLLRRLLAGIGGSRVSLWSSLAAEVGDSLYTGAGLRASEVVLGRYPHNSYLGLLHDAGLVGLGIFLLILASVALPALREWLDGDLEVATPWWWSLVALVPFLFVFSFAYQPLTWLVVALLAVGIPAAD